MTATKTVSPIQYIAGSELLGLACEAESIEEPITGASARCTAPHRTEEYDAGESLCEYDPAEAAEDRRRRHGERAACEARDE